MGGVDRVVFGYSLLCYPGQYLQVETTDLTCNSTTVHMLCGEHHLRGAECPSCGEKLMQILQLDSTDPNVGLGDWGLPRLHLLWCWPCQAFSNHVPFSYKYSSENEIKVLTCGFSAYPKITERFGFEMDQLLEEFPYEGYPKSFPACRVRLESMMRADQDRLANAQQNGDQYYRLEQQLRDAFESRHQIGGIPFLAWSLSRVCPSCEGRLCLLASIKDANTDPRGFTGNSAAYLIFALCTRCKIIVGENFVC